MNSKILFTGPVGAGKTSAITHLSDIAVIATEARATDDTARLKEMTTVAMDYGQLRLDDGSVVPSVPGRPDSSASRSCGTSSSPARSASSSYCPRTRPIRSRTWKPSPVTSSSSSPRAGRRSA
ncbi:MAG: hypothetical protein U5R48_16655 [Gammaproteobacteria bacterium]|nr:hypothetical protein [Gammaproteobacteria bacterium]